MMMMGVGVAGVAVGHNVVAGTRGVRVNRPVLLERPISSPARKLHQQQAAQGAGGESTGCSPSSILRPMSIPVRSIICSPY